MTDNNSGPSRRQVLAGLGTIGVASAGAGLGTTAFFSDRTTFRNNYLEAGELALKLDWQQTYNGPNPKTGVAEEHPVNAYPDDSGDGIQDLGGIKYSSAGDTKPVFNAAEIPACCDCEDEEYYVTYAGDTFCIEAIDGDVSAETFYDYVPAEVSSRNEDITRDDTAVLFLYRDDQGELYLFIVLDEFGDGDGGAASFKVEGAEECEWLSADWVVQDDPITTNDDYQNADGNLPATADWVWGEERTDGGVLGTLEEEFALRITPKLNDAATLDPANFPNFISDFGPVERLIFLSGDAETEIVLEDGITDETGKLDPIVVHSTCGIETLDKLSTDVYASKFYPDQRSLIELDDVKPGDEGEITFSMHLCDNPGYIWLFAKNIDFDGELAEYLDVVLWYDDDCNNVFDDDEIEIFSGSFSELLDLLNNGKESLPLDADPKNPETIDCFDPETGYCIGFTWEFPVRQFDEIDERDNNDVQGDSLKFDLGFYTEQCRHNDGPNAGDVTPINPDIPE
ncbi:hypothetical protein HUB97_12255 [Halorubraceae archaeon YAN]|nr:hypothetical protein [Halorubraceae archaeon YAN]